MEQKLNYRTTHRLSSHTNFQSFKRISNFEKFVIKELLIRSMTLWLQQMLNVILEGLVRKTDATFHLNFKLHTFFLSDP